MRRPSRNALQKLSKLAAILPALARRSGSGTAGEEPMAPICENVKEWDENRSESDCRVLLPPRRIARDLPHTIEARVHQQYVDRQVADQREKYLVRVHGAKILGENGLVVLPDGRYASESIYGRSLLEQDPDYHAPKPRPIVTKSGSFFSLLVIWSKSGSYYHWLHDTLQRLYRVIELLPEDTRYIVPASLSSFQLETLRIVGVEENQLAFFSGEAVWELETLYFSPPTTNSGSHRLEADEWLRDKFFSEYGVRPTTGGRRIFISRQGMSQRRMANERAVSAYLQKHGFETCMPETLSLRDQVELFSQADVIVAAHGSALANMLFARPGLVVVDMIQPSMLTWAYVFWAMSEELGHRYWYFLAESVPRRGHQDDTYVPLDKLAATFDRIQLD